MTRLGGAGAGRAAGGSYPFGAFLREPRSCAISDSRRNQNLPRRAPCTTPALRSWRSRSALYPNSSAAIESSTKRSSPAMPSVYGLTPNCSTRFLVLDQIVAIIGVTPNKEDSLPIGGSGTQWPIGA